LFSESHTINGALSAISFTAWRVMIHQPQKEPVKATVTLPAKDDSYSRIPRAVGDSETVASSEDQNISVPSPHTSTSPIPTPPPATGTIAASFIQQDGSEWRQSEAYIGVSVSDWQNASKVEWYEGTDNPTLKFTDTQHTQNLFQYNWPIKFVPKGKYHWTARVYDTAGNFQYVTNNHNQPYVDMIVL